jgi:YidC/Oxa1 family membrane protein insertase
MERRALLAAVISILILIGYQYVIGFIYPPPHPLMTETVAEPRPSGPPVAVPEEIPRPVAPKLVEAAADARTITVETEFYRVVFVSMGARIESFQLKKHRTTVDPNSPLQETVIAGQGGELPFGVDLRGTAAVLSDTGAPYEVDSGNIYLQPGRSASLDFVWHADPATIRKRFTFHGDRYDFEGTFSASDVPAEYAELGVSWIKLADAAPAPGGEVIFDRTFYIDGRKLVETWYNDLADGKILTGDLTWTGYAGRYFLAGALPLEDQKYRLWMKLRDHTVEKMLLFPITGGSAEVTLDVYVGPKKLDALEAVGRGLTRAVNVGFFSFIALPLLRVLQFSHRFTGNYGVDIILLTVLIKILFIPLTNRSFKSMREMQKLQPQMVKIREKFKDNPEQMNKEIMEMYRRHKVNPLGGCLPMVLQIPVFIGLYEALQNAVELRHAPFMLWINDLSAPDRLGSLQLPFVEHPGIPVLTLLMGASMFAQQWMTPSAGDPTQQRIMMIMPLIFTFMFVNFPSGLVLYWLVNNILTIAQQYYTYRTAP